MSSRRTDSAQFRSDGLKRAALLPVIHQEIWQRYQGNLPDDAVIKRYLVVDKKFNEQYVDEFINQFRRTIEFAKLSSGDTIESAATESDFQAAPMTQSAPETRTLAIPPPRKQLFNGGGPAIPMAPALDELSLPLESGKMIHIPKMTEDDYELFLETLQLWKRRIIIKTSIKESAEPEKI
jgi:hypothetical protein